MAIKTENASTVFVYETPVRLWHWLNVLVMLALFVTGYFIGVPLPSVGGEASDHYLMGYIRFVHFAGAYIFMIAFLGRIYWAIVGNNHAREMFLPPLFNAKWWGGVWHCLKWYLFLEKQPRKYTGHNPLSVLVLHFVFVWCVLFMIITGLSMYGEGTGMGTWQYNFFTSWVNPAFGQSQDVHTWHRLGMWILICFSIVHIYTAIREEIFSRQTIMSSMITGSRSFKDDGPVDDLH